MATTTSKSQHITVLPRPTLLDVAGMNKGINHDRQHLGIILAAGQEIKVRQTNTAFTKDITLRLLNMDGNTETSKKVGNSWVPLSVNAVAVPFIDTPYTSGMAPVVEYEYPNNSKSLPVYRRGESESTFFSAWESQNAEFGLIEADYAIILVPEVSKNDLKKQNIDGLIGYYESIFTFYNALTGVSFEPQRASDLNVRNRYFLKADKTGPGGAYYSDSWTAESSSSVSSFWLEPVATNWGSLHEIAHGYQGNFMQDKYLSTGEVWNNIYAAGYQSVMLGDRKYTEGWMYGYGDQESIEKTITDNIAARKVVNTWDLRLKLYFLVTMVETAGWNTFTHFNQQYRLNSNTPGFVPHNHALLDMLSESFASVGRQVDVTPFVQLAGGYITPAQRERNLFSHAKAVYPLNQLVQGETLKTLQQQLKLQSAISLVDVQQLQASDLKGDVTLQLQIDDFGQIYGETITLLVGAVYARQLPINSQTLVLPELPIGVYTLRLPTGRNYKYQPQLGYLVVKPGQNKQQADFVRKATSTLASQEIILLGLGDGIFCTVLVDQVNRVVKVDVNKTTPHSYFPDVTYAEVVIKNKGGVEQFRKTIPGTKATISHDEVPFEVGYKLQIYHEEPSRVKLSPAFDGVIDNKTKTNVFEITASGLENEALQNDPQNALLAQIERAATALRGNYTMLHAECAAKVDIFLAINLFPSPQRESLLRQYADCIPANNSPPEEVHVGDNFTSSLINGIVDRTACFFG